MFIPKTDGDITKEENYRQILLINIDEKNFKTLANWIQQNIKKIIYIIYKLVSSAGCKMVQDEQIN